MTTQWYTDPRRYEHIASLTTYISNQPKPFIFTPKKFFKIYLPAHRYMTIGFTLSNPCTIYYLSSDPQFNTISTSDIVSSNDNLPRSLY